MRGEPSISIIDNDDFSNDTLTGGGTTHHCKWMFPQRLKHCNSRLQEIEASLDDVPMRIQDAKLGHSYSVKKHPKCRQ